MTRELSSILNSVKEIEESMGVLWVEKYATQLNDIEDSAKILDRRINRINEFSQDFIVKSLSDELLSEANE